MKKHIICFGDSNTHGYCAMNDGRFDENERWTCLLQKSLGEDYLILEEGLSGRTTCLRDPVFEGLSGLDYLYPCLMSHEPVGLLVIMLGTNDTKERFSAGAPAIGLGMAAEYKRIAGQFGCYYLDANEVVKAAPNDIDHMHLTAQGHKELAEALDKKIREIFEQQ